MAYFSVHVTNEQPVYIYLGTAVVVGIIAGSILHLVMRSMTSVFQLQSGMEVGQPSTKMKKGKKAGEEVEAGLTNGQSRRRNEVRMSQDHGSSGREGSKTRSYLDRYEHTRTQPRAGLLSQVILEEEDDSDEVT